MAGVMQKAERKAKAVANIEQSASALVKKFGLDVDAPSISKYPEYAELDRLDYVAIVLTAILDKVNAEQVNAEQAQAKPEKQEAPERKGKGGKDDK